MFKCTYTPIFDFADAPIDMIARHYVGDIQFKTLTNPPSVLAIDLNSGEVDLHSSCTAGTIIVRGVGALTDNSTGSTVVTSTGLVNTTLITDAVWDEPISDHLTQFTTGGELYSGSASFSGSVSVDPDAIADAVWDEAISDHLTPFTTGGELYSGSSSLDSTSVASAVWDADPDSYKTQGSFGECDVGQDDPGHF